MINASVICMNPLSIDDDAQLIFNNGVKSLHFDVMDSTYVRRFGLYPEIHRELAKNYKFTSDCHLMVQDVAKGIKEWCGYTSPQKISFHYKDNKEHITYLMDMLLDYQVEPIFAIDVDVDINEVINAIDEYEPAGLMFLSIIPGVLKQKHKPELVFQKIQTLKESNQFAKIKYIQVDGGVNFQTIPKLIKSGANDLICGSSTLFKNPNGYTDDIRKSQIISNINHLNSVI